MAEYLETFINVVYDIKSNWPDRNSSSLELLNLVMTNDKLLEAVANRTNLPVEYINNTLNSVLINADRIAEVYEWLNSTEEEGSTTLNTSYQQPSCSPSIAPNEMIAYSFIPAFLIIIILSMVTTRVWKKAFCKGRPGLAVPVNLLDSYENRFCYAFAFGATASRIVLVIVDGDYAQVFGSEYEKERKKNTFPSYYSALFRILAALMVGVSYYPFFSCISTNQRLLGAVLGTMYSTSWFFAYVSQLVDCATHPDDKKEIAENILLSLPPLVCHGLLVLCFLRVLVTCLIRRHRIVVTKDEWKENYKYNYVKKLLKPIPKSEQTVVIIDGFKHKIVSNLYKWRPDFKYSTRMVCIYITACVSLYLVIISFVQAGRLLASFLIEMVDNFSVDKDLVNSGINWSRIKEGIEVGKVCWMVSIGLACCKDVIMMANMLSWYRGHALRLQRGDRSFLPVSIENEAPSNIMVASFKFAGYQVAYLLWGFIITLIAVFLAMSVLAFVFIWPLTWGNVENSLGLAIFLKIWPSLVISLLTVLAQRLMAKYIFLRDFGATLALNNRRLFHIASYFLFFLNIFVGLISCLIRIFFAMLFGILFLPRLQKSALPRDWELFDPGYKTYVGYLCLEHSHTNPILVTFSKLVLDAVSEEKLEESKVRRITGRKERNKWFLAVTLINNPELKHLRHQESQKTVSAGLFNLATAIIKPTNVCETEHDTAM